MGTQKYVYKFEEGDGTNRYLFGGKGAGLCEMTKIGLPVPPGFVITTEACRQYYKDGRKLSESVKRQVTEAMASLEQTTGKKFGDPENPLLVSVRSGAAVSMPGMMDTILNLGLTRKTLGGLARATNDERFAWDAYRRLLQLFGKVALNVPGEILDRLLEDAKRDAGVSQDVELGISELKALCEQLVKAIEDHTGRPFNEDPWNQLFLAISAVFDSWMGKRAVDYRKQFNITPEMANGTAVNIVTMVFGNLGETSATGVAFTRDPATGENRLFGEYLVNAQGEDVVAGIRTPKPISELADEMPQVYKELQEVRQTLERHYKEVQDFEFTIERGKLYILQTRNGKLNARATVKTSVDMEKEGLLTRKEALLRVSPEHLTQLMHPHIDPKEKPAPLASGIPASPGAASGKIVLDPDRAEEFKKTSGDPLILVREETKPEDIHGFFASEGILTLRGGKTSHAAVVARGMGKPCVVGCEALKIDPDAQEVAIGSQVFHEGDWITIDGSTGEVYPGRVPTIEPRMDEDLNTLLTWADEIRTLGVRANADTPEAAKKALGLGAEGIGLCRTERMFNAPDRLSIVQEMILAETEEKRREAIEKLLPFQRNDFKEILKTMEGKPVTVRLLDPPLHEFLPDPESLILEVENLKNFAGTLRGLEELPGIIRMLDPSLHDYLPPIERVLKELEEIKKRREDEAFLQKKEELLKKVRALAEVNPMLGHRGIRLGITYPEIYEMQIRALLEAAAELLKEGRDVRPEIMVPQVCTAQELKWVHRMVREIHAEVEESFGITVPFHFGTMIEVVRACMRAGRLAEVADFFSFGTNDLTQATFSFSREDAENKFLPLYNERKILQDNPFEVLDQKGVGRLMMITIEWGRRTKPDLTIGICGEHGGHPASIEFCHNIGLTYVSCSVNRLPIARLAAAHAKIREVKGKLPEGLDSDYPFVIYF